MLFTLNLIGEFSNKRGTFKFSGVGGGKRRGLGPRNDVLTTCKAVFTPRGGQRIIAVFFLLNDLDFLEARSEPAEEIRNTEKYEKHNIMHLGFSCISYLSFGTEIAEETVLDLNQQQCARSIYIGYIALPGKDNLMLIKITGESVKLIGSKYIQRA